MKTYNLLIALVLIGALLLPSCASNARVGSLQSESQSVELGGAKSAQVEIDFGAGNLELTGGTEKLMEGDFTYNVAKLKPEVKYMDDMLVIRQPDVKGLPDLRGITNYRNEWSLRLNKEVLMDLCISVGAGTNELHLAGLSLNRLHVSLGAGISTIDLNNNWARNLDVSIDTGAADITLQLPKDIGVRVEVDSGPTIVEAPDMKKVGNSYLNSAYGESQVTLQVKMAPGIGRIFLEVEDEATASHH